MANKVLTRIALKANTAKYFSVSADSSPDMSHVDQLTFIIHYISENGTVKERFTKFIPNCDHKSKNLAKTVFNILQELELDIKNCRGQSYDNASNMSEAYTGLQARIKEANLLAEYVPCSAHSLNLVSTCAAECYLEAVCFFTVVQELYIFFFSIYTQMGNSYISFEI